LQGKGVLGVWLGGAGSCRAAELGAERLFCNFFFQFFAVEETVQLSPHIPVSLFPSQDSLSPPQFASPIWVQRFEPGRAPRLSLGLEITQGAQRHWVLLAGWAVSAGALGYSCDPSLRAWGRGAACAPRHRPRGSSQGLGFGEALAMPSANRYPRNVKYLSCLLYSAFSGCLVMLSQAVYL